VMTGNSEAASCSRVGKMHYCEVGPPNPAFKTWNNCPPNFTVQDGLCKPYTGR
jgi:hypothetical protein